MGILSFSFNAVAPILFCVLLGRVARVGGLLKPEFIPQLNVLSVRVLIPLLIFNNVRGINFRERQASGLILFAVAGLLLSLAALWLLFGWRVKNRARACALISGTFRGNYLLFALAICQSMYGAEGVRVASILIPVSSVVSNFLGVLVMCVYSGKRNGPGNSLLVSASADILRNPQIISALLGVLVSLSGVGLPAWANTTLNNLGSMAMPVAFLLMGALLDWQSIRHDLRGIMTAVFFRLAAVPAVGVWAAVAAGFRGAELGALLVLFGAPSPVVTSLMAREYRMDPEFASELVLATTVLSGLSLFLWIALLRYLALL